MFAFYHELFDLPIPEFYLIIGRYLDSLCDHFHCFLIIRKSIVSLCEVIVKLRFDVWQIPIKTQRALDVSIHQHEIMPVYVVLIIKFLEKLLVSSLGTALQHFLIGEMLLDSLSSLDQTIDDWSGIHIYVFIGVLHHVCIKTDPQQFFS